MRPLHAVGYSGGVLVALAGVVGAITALRTSPTAPTIPVSPPPPVVPGPPLVVTPPPVDTVPTPRIEPPRCCACAMAEMRRQSRQRHHTVRARYLGADTPTPRCTARNRDTTESARTRFALVGPSPWQGVDYTADRLAHMLVPLACPELSRPAYQKLYGITDGPDAADGLGTAPALRIGATYTLTVVDAVDLVGPTDDTTEYVWTALAIDP